MDCFKGLKGIARGRGDRKVDTRVETDSVKAFHGSCWLI